MAPIRLRITRWEDVKQQWHKFKVKNRIIRATRLDCSFGVTRTDNEWLSGSPGDWLIEESDGALVPCSHELFVKNYEPLKKNWPVRRKNHAKAKRTKAKAVHVRSAVRRKPNARPDADRGRRRDQA